MPKRIVGSLVALMLVAVIPTRAQAQIEIGMDAGWTITSIDGIDDDLTQINLITETLRLGFPLGDPLILESAVSFQRLSQGDNAQSTLLLLPGLVFLFGDESPDASRFYLRGEGGLSRVSVSNGTDDSETQFGVGGAAGLRSPLGESGLLRLEGGFDVFFEKKEDDQVTSQGFKVFRLLVGVSLVVQ